MNETLDELARRSGPSHSIDVCGEVCPFAFVRCKLRLEELPPGAQLAITLDHPASARNVPRSLAAEGYRVLSIAGPEAGRWHIVVENP